MKEGTIKSLDVLATHVLEDVGAWCAVDPRRSITTLRRRVEAEGDAFLTLTLPTFGKALERALTLGYLDASDWPSTWGFRRGFPVFLQEFLRLIFDEHGKLFDAPSAHAIKAVRQVTLMFAKMEGACSLERDQNSIQRYIDTERELHENDFVCDVDRSGEFDRLARRLWGPVLNRIAERISNYEIMPKHGPGNTADRLPSNQKFASRTWTSRLEKEFPFNIYGGAQVNPEASDYLQPVFLSPPNEIPARVITVPKTAAASRVISLEPTWNQLVQQALLEALTEEIDADALLGPLCSNSSQEPNRLLAQRGSIDGAYATIDLSDASDRVQLSLVKRTLAASSITLDALLACRSTHADVPGIGVIPLSKFASMGSANTFPVETMVFTTVVLWAMQSQIGTPFTRDAVKQLRGHVRVYGDDIIVPAQYAQSVVNALEAFGLKVNHSKSFWTGRFRESCGGDYYAGSDVGVVRLKHQLPTTDREPDLVRGLVEFRNRLAKADLSKTANVLDGHIANLLREYPWVPEGTPGLGRVDPYNASRVEGRFRTDGDNQRLLVATHVVVEPIPEDPLDGYGALWKHYLRRGLLPREDGHLQFAGRPKSATLKLRYVPLA